jgi:DNA-binding HxlR family transcriptional regulator
MEEGPTPAEAVLDIIGGKWKLRILGRLASGPTRFNQLHRDIPAVTPRVLARALRELETDDMVARTVHPETPIRVEYALTDRGNSLEPLLHHLTRWGEQHAPRGRAQSCPGLAVGSPATLAASSSRRS